MYTTRVYSTLGMYTTVTPEVHRLRRVSSLSPGLREGQRGAFYPPFSEGERQQRGAFYPHSLGEWTITKRVLSSLFVEDCGHNEARLIVNLWEKQGDPAEKRASLSVRFVEFLTLISAPFAPFWHFWTVPSSQRIP